VQSDELQQGVGNQNLSDFTALYNMFMGVQCMMFFGFGYLMTFLKRYGLGAVGFTMLVTVISLEWGVICEVLICKHFYSYAFVLNYLLSSQAFFTQMEDGVYGPIEIHVPALINGSFAAAALLISFGGVIGRVSPLQLVVMSLVRNFLAIDVECQLIFSFQN
jgi:ammonium transporter Rh